MKKIISMILSAVLILSQALYSSADEYIATDPAANVYTGRREASNMIMNLSFIDVPATHWANERIARAGALDMLKGSANGRFNPEGRVSNQEALAFVIRVMGQEREAQALSAALQSADPTQTLWSIGYLNLALRNGLITTVQYNQLTASDQSSLLPPALLREGNAAREDVAQWIYQGLLSLNPEAFDSIASRQAVYTFSDSGNISPNRLEAVDAVAATNIMRGSDGRFNPRASLTRAEMATLLANMDSIYLPVVNLEKKTGTVGSVLDGQATSTGIASVGREFLIRTADGTVDALLYSFVQDSSPQSGALDAPVYKNGGIGGLPMLAEGDEIEYLINFETGEVIYVQVTGSLQTPDAIRTVHGRLQSVDADERSVTIVDSNNKAFTYTVVAGIFPGDDIILFSGKAHEISRLPIGSRVNLRLRNHIVDEITYAGEPATLQEMRGIVVENNPNFGYITFVDNNGNEITKQYLSGELMAEKRPFYMSGDVAGYLTHVFPNFVYNPHSAPISSIEPGDIIFMRLNPDDLNTITSISAAANYMMRYGKVRTFTSDGNTAGLWIEYENKQTAWFDLASAIPITKGGRLISSANVIPGDWVRILVNQAIVEPGAVIETVKEMTVEGGEERFISSIIKGQLAGINAIQGQLIIQNAETLQKNGWSDYQNLMQFSLAGREIEFYANNAPVTLDYIDRYLKRADGEVYVALENHFTGERIRRVTFRESRDELLPADVVTNANGNGGFMITGIDGTITTDAGTIVRRHGRLVDGMHILPPDWAVVSLNGHNRAAVVDITDTPGTSGIHIIRGRILSIDAGKSFRVQSMATLVENGWVFSPVQREFTIDNQTLFLDASGGVRSMNEWIDYGSNSVIDRVYNIVVDGGRAARVIDTPYATSSVRGIIYEAGDGSISIRNAEYLDSQTGRWSLISRQNGTLHISLSGSSIIVKESRIATPSGLVSGDFVRIMTTELNAPPVPGARLNGMIVRVER